MTTVAGVDTFVAAQVLAYAAADPETEQCGLVYGRAVTWITNRASDPTKFFEMDNEELLDQYTEFGHPDAVWHSHPNGDPNPSKADIMGAPPGVLYLIAAGGKVYAYDFSGR